MQKKSTNQPILPCGARAYVDGEQEVIISQSFPEGSHALWGPHYKVHFVGGDRNVAVSMKRVGVVRKGL